MRCSCSCSCCGGAAAAGCGFLRLGGRYGRGVASQARRLHGRCGCSRRPWSAPRSTPRMPVRIAGNWVTTGFFSLSATRISCVDRRRFYRRSASATRLQARGQSTSASPTGLRGSLPPDSVLRLRSHITVCRLPQTWLEPRRPAVRPAGRPRAPSPSAPATCRRRARRSRPRSHRASTGGGSAATRPPAARQAGVVTEDAQQHHGDDAAAAAACRAPRSLSATP